MNTLEPGKPVLINLDSGETYVGTLVDCEFVILNFKGNKNEAGIDNISVPIENVVSWTPLPDASCAQELHLIGYRISYKYQEKNEDQWTPYTFFRNYKDAKDAADSLEKLLKVHTRILPIFTYHLSSKVLEGAS